MGARAGSTRVMVIWEAVCGVNVKRMRVWARAHT